MSRPRVLISLEQGDVTTTDGDIIAVKYARGFHGVDYVIASKLGLDHGPTLGEHEFHPAPKGYGAREVLYVGVPALGSFRYAEIRRFASDVLGILAAERQGCQRLLMTMHGVGYGLDENEALLAQVAGMKDAIEAGRIPAALREIAIVEMDDERIVRLRPLIPSTVQKAARSKPTARRPRKKPASDAVTAGRTSEDKPHAFVAMPFRTDMKDIYYLGIKQPIQRVGWLCERVDQAVFTGDILDRIKDRISSARVVIAEVTGKSANVYLEIGYAWGVRTPTILLARAGEELGFDVQGHRCLYYNDIMELRSVLGKELRGLKAG